MGAKKLEQVRRKPKNHRLVEMDYDNNPTARHNLLSIIKERARVLYPHEVSWFLGKSLSEVYATVPRVKSQGTEVRFDPELVDGLKTSSLPLGRSVTIEKKPKSVGLPFNSQPKRGKVKATLCL